jgi:ketosteroid isomerase-like protein
VEIVRRWIEAFNRGDVAGVLEVADPDVEWWNREDDPGAPVSQGHDGLTTGIAELEESLAELRVEPKEFIEAGESVVVPVRVVGRGRESGASFEEHEVHVFTLRDGKVTEGREYRENSEALKAVGLPEQARSGGNVEIVRSAFLALADRGFDGLVEFLHPEINWRAMEGAPDDVGEMQGMQAARHYVEDWFETFDDFTTIPEELLDAGEDRVVGVLHITGRAKLSGITTELRYAVLYTLRDDKIARIREYADREEALDAAGLE